MNYMMGIGVCNSIGVGRGGGINPNGAPSNLILTLTSDTQFDFTFDIGSTDHDGHYVYRSVDGITYALYDTLTGATNTFTDATLSSGSRYWYYVRAYKGTGLSVASNIVSNIYLHLFDASKNFLQPVDFTPTLPCTFTRDANNIIQHDMDFTQYTGGTVVFVNLDTGNDTTGDGSAGTPYKTLSKALRVARDGADASYCIKVKNDSFFLHDEGWYGAAMTFTNKIVAVIPDNPSNRIRITTGYRNTYADQGGGVWKCTRASVYGVSDMSQVDANGVPIPMTCKATQAECEATANTWYTDASSVWIHTADGLVPTTDVITHLSTAPTLALVGTSKFYMKNVTHISHIYGGFVVQGDITGATYVGEFCHDGCIFCGGSKLVGATYGDSINFNSVKNVYGFSSIAAYSANDGFSYATAAAIAAAHKRDYFNLEYNCIAYTHRDNCSTSHTGVNTLRINGDYHHGGAAVVTDVNACYSIYLDCNSHNSTTSTRPAYSALSASGPSGVTGKLVMVNTTHNNETYDTYDVLSDVGTTMIFYGTNLTEASAGTPTYIPHA